MLFCWPAQGGADVDLFHVLKGLKERAMDVRLFVPHFESVAGRGIVQEEELPFPCTVLPVNPSCCRADRVVETLRAAVDQWKPDVVFLSHGYALKPLVALALAQYPLISRYYAHELLCARDAYRFKDGIPCDYNYLRYPDYCRRCAFQSLAPQIKLGREEAWLQDYLLARAYETGYYALFRKALDIMDALVVFNTALRDSLARYKDKVHVIPGGVSLLPEGPSPSLPFLQNNDKKRIFMAGRVDDPAKGLSLLLEAGARLLRKRDDFHIYATHFDPLWQGPFFSSTGWMPYDTLRRTYGEMDICVIPSRWEEPFGLVALESMSAGTVVCAADCGGLHDIVLHQETGLLFDSGDSNALFNALDWLLDHEEQRRSLGAAGLERVQKHYLWNHVIDTYYLPLLESVVK